MILCRLFVTKNERKQCVACCTYGSLRGVHSRLRERLGDTRPGFCTGTLVRTHELFGAPNRIPTVLTTVRRLRSTVYGVTAVLHHMIRRFVCSNVGTAKSDPSAQVVAYKFQQNSSAYKFQLNKFMFTWSRARLSQEVDEGGRSLVHCSHQPLACPSYWFRPCSPCPRSETPAAPHSTLPS
jgi:hypothetical protein